MKPLKKPLNIFKALISLVFFPLYICAQNPVLTLTAYDQNDSILSISNAFYINSKGEAIAEYDLVKNAYKLIATDHHKKQFKVTRVLGASSLKNLVKIQIENSPTTFFPISPQVAKIKDKGFIKTINHKVKTQITSAIPYEHGFYYTLSEKTPNLSSLPLLNKKNELLGITQKSANQDNKLFAIDANFLKDLTLTLKNIYNSDISALHLPKGIPSDEKEATNYLYMLLHSHTDTLTLSSALTDFQNNFPNNPLAYTYKAEYLTQQRNIKEALSLFNQAIEIANNTQDEILYAFSKTIFNDLELYPQDSVIWSYSLGLQHIEKAYHLNPQPLYLLLQAQYLHQMGFYQKALKLYQQVVKTNLRTPEIYFNAALAQESLNTDINLTISLVDSALTLLPSPPPTAYAPYIYKRALLLEKANRKKEAVLTYLFYEQLIGKNNLPQSFFQHRYELALENKMYQQALNDATYLLSLQPQNCDYLLNKAYILLIDNQFDSAIHLAQRALALCPSNKDCFKVLGISYGEKRNYAKALQYLKKAKELKAEKIDFFIKKYSK